MTRAHRFKWSARFGIAALLVALSLPALVVLTIKARADELNPVFGTVAIIGISAVFAFSALEMVYRWVDPHTIRWHLERIEGRRGVGGDR